MNPTQNPYAAWGGLAAQLYELEHGPEECVRDPCVQKLTRLDKAIAEDQHQSDHAAMTFVDVFDDCAFTIEDVNRLNSVLLDGLCGVLVQEPLAELQKAGATVVRSSAALRDGTGKVAARSLQLVRCISPVVNIPALRLVLALGGDVHADQEAPLRTAVAAGSLEAANVLLEHGATAVVPNNALLVAAAEAGHWSVFQTLLRHGALLNINAAGLAGKRLIQESHKILDAIMAAQRIDMLRLLTDPAHVDPRLYATANGQNLPGTFREQWLSKTERQRLEEMLYTHCLRMTARDNRVDMLRALLEDPTYVADRKLLINLCEQAASMGRVNVLKFLLERGVSVNDGEILERSVNSSLEMVKFLVEQGAHINPPGTDDGRDPGHCALRSSTHNMEIFHYLLDHGARLYACVVEDASYRRLINVLQVYRERFPVDFARFATVGLYSEPHESVMDDDEKLAPIVMGILLDGGADLHQNDEAPLRFAIQHANLPWVQLLLSRGAVINHGGANPAIGVAIDAAVAEAQSPNQEDEDEVVPRSKSLHVLRALLEAGADLQLAPYPVRQAMQSNVQPVIDLLMQYGAQRPVPVSTETSNEAAS